MSSGNSTAVVIKNAYTLLLDVRNDVTSHKVSGFVCVSVYETSIAFCLRVCSGIKSDIIFGKLSSDRYRLSLFHCKRNHPL